MAMRPDVEPTDAQIVAGCRQGDEASWNALVERFSRYVMAIATQGFRLAEHDAEDVFQDVFARAFDRLDTLRASGRVVLVDDVIEQAADDVIAKLDEAMAVRAGLDALGDDCQDVLDRFFCRDESYRTIGEELGIPAGTIASRISRCLGRLRAELEGRNLAPPPSSE